MNGVFNVGKKHNLSDRKYVGNGPKFSNRNVLANSADPDQTASEEQSDQGLHCLLYGPYIL